MAAHAHARLATRANAAHVARIEKLSTPESKGALHGAPSRTDSKSLFGRRKFSDRHGRGSVERGFASAGHPMRQVSG